MKILKRSYTICIFTVALVSSLVASAAPRFSRSEPELGQPVVTDSVTGLMWQGCTADLSGADCTTGVAGGYRWKPPLAFDYCNDLSWGGFDDWTLPTVKELRSIVDNKAYDPAIYQNVFPGTESGSYWSSSAETGNAGKAWSVDFNNGWVNSNVKSSSNHLRCVRR